MLSGTSPAEFYRALHEPDIERLGLADLGHRSQSPFPASFHQSFFG
jgi:hypothetical protein